MKIEIKAQAFWVHLKIDGIEYIAEFSTSAQAIENARKIAEAFLGRMRESFEAGFDAAWGETCEGCNGEHTSKCFDYKALKERKLAEVLPADTAEWEKSGGG